MIGPVTSHANPNACRWCVGPLSWLACLSCETQQNPEGSLVTVDAGGIAAARNLRALKAAGISHVVNASPIVPCFHRSKMRYRVVSVFDDPEDDIMQFFEATNRYIAKVCSQQN